MKITITVGLSFSAKELFSRRGGRSKACFKLSVSGDDRKSGQWLEGSWKEEAGDALPPFLFWIPFVADPALRSLAFSIVSQIVSRNDHEVITTYTISKLRWQQCIHSVSATKVARAEADFIILCIEMLACLDFGIACTLLCMTYGSFCLVVHGKRRPLELHVVSSGNP